MAADEVGGARLLLGPSRDEIAEAVADDDPRPVLVWSRIADKASGGPKGLGVDRDAPSSWLALVDHVLVEADGSRGHPAKAPAPHDPALPAGPTDVVAVIGADRKTNGLVLEQAPGVDRVMKVLAPYKMAAREIQGGQPTQVRVGGNCVFGGEDVPVMAGPCSVECAEQILEAAWSVKAAGALCAACPRRPAGPSPG